MEMGGLLMGVFYFDLGFFGFVFVRRKELGMGFCRLVEMSVWVMDDILEPLRVISVRDLVM